METELEAILNDNNKTLENKNLIPNESKVVNDESYKASLDSLMDYLDELQKDK